MMDKLGRLVPRHGVDNCHAGIQAFRMPKFWTWPRFWIGLILVAWIVYLLAGNLEQSVTLFIVPLWVHPTARLSAIILGSAIFGCLLTLLVQFAWRRRASKYAAVSANAPVSSSNTAA
jgi:uncharacterized integral membrane protein